MREKQARALAEQIDSETGGKIRVVLRKYRTDKDTALYCLLAYNPTLQRKITIHNEFDWQSIKEVWEIAA